MKKLQILIIILILAILFFLWPTFAESPQKQPAPSPVIQTIRVSNETELINAIGSNRVIELNPGIYSLSKMYTIQTQYCTWRNIGDGYELEIDKVENLSIIGLGEEPVKIHAEPPRAFVLSYTNSNHIQLKNIEAGHFPEQGLCSGGVLNFGNSKNIVIENSVLFGCGKEGLTVSQVDNLQFTNSTIKDCSDGIMTVNNSTNLTFSSSRFFNNGSYDLINFTQCTGISFTQCELFQNKATSGYGFLNIDNCRSIVFKDCRIHDNVAAHFLVATDKETVSITNTVFQNNYFNEGGYICSIDGIFMRRWSAKDFLRKEFYKRLEYLSRKVNDPEKLDKPKARKLFEAYWQKAVSDLNGLAKKQGLDWETESLLGKFYQVGISIGIKDAWDSAEAYLKNAIKLNPALPRNNHLALGVLYASRHFTFTWGETGGQVKLIVGYKPAKPDFMAAARKELAKDNGFPGTANMYLFLMDYFQGNFDAAYLQANRYLAVFPDDELMKKLRGMAKKRMGNKQAPGELNVYIEREKVRRLFDFYFIQGSTSSADIQFNNSSQGINPFQLHLQEFAQNGPEYKFGNTRNEMIQNLGNPVSVETEIVENRHQPSQMDTIYTLTFDGFKTSIYDSGDHEIMLYQKITSPKFPVKYGLNIGAAKHKVKETLGTPQEEQENKLLYCYMDENGYQTIIVFSTTGDKITAIEWNFPID